MATTNPLQQLLIVLVMMLLGFYLQELPTSNVLQLSLPDWPYILTLYFATSNRYYFGVISAFIIGMVQDVFLGVPTLGLHAGIYTLSAFIMIAGRLRFKHLSLPAQSCGVGCLVLIKIVIVMIYNTVFYSAPSHFWHMLSIPFSILLWPMIHVFFQFFANRHMD